MTHDDITAVLAREPALAIYGFTTERALRPDKLRHEQERLLQSAELCTRICEWLAPTTRVKNVSPYYSSYVIKHHCEHDLGTYVANGQLIAAAIQLGIAYKQIGKGPNAYFALSRNWWADRERQGAYHI